MCEGNHQTKEIWSALAPTGIRRHRRKRLLECTTQQGCGNHGSRVQTKRARNTSINPSKRKTSNLDKTAQRACAAMVSTLTLMHPLTQHRDAIQGPPGPFGAQFPSLPSSWSAPGPSAAQCLAILVPSTHDSSAQPNERPRSSGGTARRRWPRCRCPTHRPRVRRKDQVAKSGMMVAGPKVAHALRPKD